MFRCGLNRVMTAVLLGCGVVAAGCGNSSEVKTGSDKAGKSLYDRLGGEAAIRLVVDDFVARGAGNARVNFARTGTQKEWKATDENVMKLKNGLVAFISENTGGPRGYRGKDMKTAHRGMMISNAEFDALAGDLKASLDKYNVPQKEQDELLAIVGSTRGDIVEVR